MLWRKLQSMRQAIARHQEQKNFNTLFQSRTICAPSAFAPPPPPQNTDLLDITYKIRVVFYNDWGASWEALEPIAHIFLKIQFLKSLCLLCPQRSAVIDFMI